MSRIAKADVNNALMVAANSLIDAGGKDGRTSRAEVKAKLATLPPEQKKLVDIFYKFIDHRDFKSGAQVTPKDINRAVEYAKKHMVAKYDLNNNGLSAEEISKMSLTGKRAVDLSRALKAAAVDTGPVTAADLPKSAIKAATDFVNANAQGGDDEFPQIGDGNCGIIAGVVAGEDGKAVLDMIRSSLQSFSAPGSPNATMIPKDVYDPAKHALVVVAGSEDEVSVHLSVMDLASGKITKLGLANTVDMADDTHDDGYERLAELLKSARRVPTAETDSGVSGLFPFGS
jgi:hypothetical protein